MKSELMRREIELLDKHRRFLKDAAFLLLDELVNTDKKKAELEALINRKKNGK